MKLIGRVAGKEERAEACCSARRQRRAATNRDSDLPPAQQPRVLYFNRAVNMLRVSGKGTQNIQHPARRRAERGRAPAVSTVTIEQVFTWNPQVILLGNFDAAMPSDLYKDPRWQSVDAVKNRRVYRMPLGGYRWDPPSQESALAWLWLAGLLQPERRSGRSARRNARLVRLSL